MSKKYNANFEEYLLSIGYLKFIFDCRKMAYEPTTRNVLSTMVNLDHRYFPKGDRAVVDFILAGVPVTDPEFTWQLRKHEIVFGLSEIGKPPTLNCPRPKIRMIDTYGQLKTEFLDDSMNVVLRMYEPDVIFKAMYDEDFVFKIDLRQ